MKKLFSTVAIALFAIVALGGISNNDSSETQKTVAVSGQILDFKSGEGLAGVKVMINESEEVAYTDFDGNFSFESIVPGLYTVSASFISYEKTELELKLDDDARVELKLVQLARK